MKKCLLILILPLFTLITSCKLLEQNQGNDKENQNDIYYKVHFDSNFGSFVESQDVKEGELVIKPTDPMKENFKFLCWTLNNEEFNFNTPITSNITLVASWEKIGYHTHNYVGTKVEPTCTEKGYTIYWCICGDSFIDSYIDELGHDEETHPAKTPTSNEIGWEEYVTCLRCDYTTYKAISKIVGAELEIIEENGRKYVYFGSYPQTHIANQNLISELNKLTDTNERGYYEYNGNEYTKVQAKPYRYGSYSMTDEYGVTITGHYTYSTGNTVEYGAIEWFKVEDIKWRILSNNYDGTYVVISEYILTVQNYYKGIYQDRVIDGVDIAPNNYKYSDIREFLNNSFLNSAFSSKQQESIVITEVDNSASTTASSDNKYACENTYDKIFLLSYKDTLNIGYGFSAIFNEYDKDRRAIVTDYAKATGISWAVSDEYLDMGSWWLRSPVYSYNPQFAAAVTSTGYVRDNGVGLHSNYGVRPAVTIAIK